MTGPFCSQCGEKKLAREDYTLKDVAGEVIGEFTHFDGRLLRTVKTLVSRPGELARAYFHGGRSRYTRPLTLFVIINLVFFLVQPHTPLLGYGYSNYTNVHNSGGPKRVAMVRAKLAGTHESEASYIGRFNTVLQDQKKSVLLFSVPVLAFAMLLLFAFDRRTFAEHLVFSVHTYAFLLVYFLGMAALLAPIVFLIVLAMRSGISLFVPTILTSELAISLVVFGGLTAYIYFAARRTYGLRGPWLLIRAFLLALTIGYLTGVYHDILFYTTFWST
jgi:hypothetical protein